MRRVGVVVEERERMGWPVAEIRRGEDGSGDGGCGGRREFDG